MNLPALRRLRREDIPEAPDWIDKLLVTMNDSFEYVYRAMSGQITFGDNIRSQIEKFTITAGNDIPYKFSNRMKVRPQGLLCVNCLQDSGYHVPITSAVYIDWTFGDEDGVITIHNISGLTNGNKYTITVLIF